MLSIITAVSLAVAIAMTVVAWRLVRGERRRADARAAALAAEIGRDAFVDLPLERAPTSASVYPDPGPMASTPTAPLFEAPATAAGRSRMAAVIALGVFIVGSVAALAVVLSGPSAASPPTSAAPAPASAPLELTALTHERDGDGLTIHGAVRNPSQGEQVNGLSAVVFLFNRDGAFTMSARTPLDARDLAPGAESRFRIVVPHATDVARYRVSFRTDGGIVAHVDRRATAMESGR